MRHASRPRARARGNHITCDRARSPRDRYASVASFLEDLRDPSRVTPGSRTSERGSRGGIRIPRWLGTSLVVVFVVTLLGSLVWLSSRRPVNQVQPERSYRAH